MEDASGDNRAEEIKLLARDHAELAIATLAEVAGDEKAKSAARVKAAEVLLARGFGAPERRVEQKVDHFIYDQRQAHLSALQKLAARNAPLRIAHDPIEDATFVEVGPKADKEDW